MGEPHLRRVVLIGLRCSGKTSVGRLLAEKLGWSFVDADDELVGRAGRSIKEIFDTDGEPAFRKLEKETLAELCERERLVIATGGGAVLDPENVRTMRKDSLVVHLDAPVEVLWERMQRDPVTGEQRPALTDLDGRSEMAAVAGRRAPLYEAARDIVVETHSLDQERAAAAIVDALAGASGA